MPRNKKGDVDTTFKDRWGKPIHVHSYLADNSGRMYYVNSHCQAVPTDEDAPAVALKDFLEEHQVRVLTPDEVLNYGKGKLPVEKAGDGSGDPVPAPAGQPPVQAPAGDGSGTDLSIVMQAVPDKALAEELRRRGYYVTAAKPCLLYL